METIADSVENVAHVIQVALTPVFLLSGVASLLSVLSTRLGRVADRVDLISERILTAQPVERRRLLRMLLNLRWRTQILDAAVILAALAGGATCLSALLLFVGTLRERAGVDSLFISFGLALVLTACALVCFVAEMMLASWSIRVKVRHADEDSEAEAAEAPEGQAP
jgi:Protein of unknown function (DUF2721)